MGCGVLAGGHLFFRFVRGDQADVNAQELAPLRRDLRALIDEAENAKQGEKGLPEHYYPVADLCNFLHFIPPPAPLRINSVVRKRIEERIEKINARLLTVTQGQLSAVDHVILVAGTPEKALAIRHFLELGELSIHTLCTDSGAAERILDGS